jgi:hypothetical protein
MDYRIEEKFGKRYFYTILILFIILAFLGFKEYYLIFRLTNWQTVKDVLGSIDAIIGILTVFFLGKKAWRDNLFNEHNHKLAKSIVVDFYKVANAIEIVRNPFISVTEQLEADKKLGESNNHKSDETNNKSIKRAYSLRWQSITSALANLDAELLEAKVVWSVDMNKNIAEYREELKKIISELYIELYNYLDKLEPVYFRTMPEKRVVNHDIIYSTMDGKDSFNQKVEALIEKIRILLNCYLKIEK